MKFGGSGNQDSQAEISFPPWAKGSFAYPGTLPNHLTTLRHPLDQMFLNESKKTPKARNFLCLYFRLTARLILIHF